MKLRLTCTSTRSIWFLPNVHMTERPAGVKFKQRKDTVERKIQPESLSTSKRVHKLECCCWRSAWAQTKAHAELILLVYLDGRTGHNMHGEAQVKCPEWGVLLVADEKLLHEGRWRRCCTTYIWFASCELNQSMPQRRGRRIGWATHVIPLYVSMQQPS